MILLRLFFTVLNLIDFIKTELQDLDPALQVYENLYAGRL